MERPNYETYVIESWHITPPADAFISVYHTYPGYALQCREPSQRMKESIVEDTI
jgi:hypothetical protein